MFVCKNDALHRGFLCNKVVRHCTSWVASSLPRVSPEEKEACPVHFLHMVVRRYLLQHCVRSNHCVRWNLRRIVIDGMESGSLASCGYSSGNLRNVVHERSRAWESLQNVDVLEAGDLDFCLVGAMMFLSRNEAEHQDVIAIALGRGAPQNSSSKPLPRDDRGVLKPKSRR